MFVCTHQGRSSCHAGYVCTYICPASLKVCAQPQCCFFPCAVWLSAWSERWNIYVVCIDSHLCTVSLNVMCICHKEMRSYSDVTVYRCTIEVYDIIHCCYINCMTGEWDFTETHARIACILLLSLYQVCIIHIPSWYVMWSTRCLTSWHQESVAGHTV